MVFDRGTLTRINRALGCLSLVLGVGALGGAADSVVHYQRFLRRAGAADGTVVANAAKTFTTTSRTGSTVTHLAYCAVVRYKAQNGEDRTFQDDICFNPPSFAIGATVIVRYDRRVPAHVMIDRGNRAYWPAIAVALVGLLCMVGGAQRLSGRWLPQAPDEQNVPIIPADPTGTVYRKSA